VPINALVPVKGTPLENLEPPSGLEMVRAIAVARIVMPRTVVRLSAGRITMSPADQALAFLAGANSVFTGDKLLTTANNEATEDAKMFEELGLVGRPAFVPYVGGGGVVGRERVGARTRPRWRPRSGRVPSARARRWRRNMSIHSVTLI